MKSKGGRSPFGAVIGARGWGYVAGTLALSHPLDFARLSFRL